MSDARMKMADTPNRAAARHTFCMVDGCSCRLPEPNQLCMIYGLPLLLAQILHERIPVSEAGANSRDLPCKLHQDRPLINGVIVRQQQRKALINTSFGYLSETLLLDGRIIRRLLYRGRKGLQLRPLHEDCTQCSHSPE